jgi:hypothetical protein
VVLFVDTFNGTFESDNAALHVRVLQAAGYTVHVASRKADPARRATCAVGGPFWLAAWWKMARSKCAGAGPGLAAAGCQRGIAIVGLEPSLPVDAARRSAGPGPGR